MPCCIFLLDIFLFFSVYPYPSGFPGDWSIFLFFVSISCNSFTMLFEKFHIRLEDCFYNFDEAVTTRLAKEVQKE